MRLLTALIFCLSASPAAAQELGDRTARPETMLPGLRLAPGDDDLREAVAAANAHPLGSLENPVRVGGPDGERAYLARLRCADGAIPHIGGRSSGGAGAFGSVTGVYGLGCGGTSLRIAFDPYHEEHREDRAPPGLQISPR